MNFKKFLVVVLICGLFRLCHAAPIITMNNLVVPKSQAPQISVYPCLISPGPKGNSANNCLAEAFQGGVGFQVRF